MSGIALIELNALRPTATVTDQHRTRPKSAQGVNLFAQSPSIPQMSDLTRESRRGSVRPLVCQLVRYD